MLYNILNILKVGGAEVKCPYCNHLDDKVIDSRPTDEHTVIRRRRECLACGSRYTTYEKIESTQLFVIKKDGTRQAFDRYKLISGVMRACEKRPIKLKQVEALADEAEQYFLNSLKKEITSKEIGEFVMEKLRHLDQVAYVRFASVYKEFKDIDTFMEELKGIMQNSTRSE
jgi:transcriptional repressor NrdR